MSNEIEKSGGGLAIPGVIAELEMTIESICDEDTAETAMDDLDLAEVLLKRAGVLGKWASWVCAKEAEILVRVARLGVDVKSRADTIAWLREKSDEQIADILSECATGVRIGVIKGRETRMRKNAEREERLVKEYGRVSDSFVDDLEKHGEVTLNVEEFVDRWAGETAPDGKMMRATIDHTHNRLLRAGAVGLGDTSGLYIDRDNDDVDKVCKVISNRVRRIHADAVALRKYCDKLGCVVPEGAIALIEDQFGSTIAALRGRLD